MNIAIVREYFDVFIPAFFHLLVVLVHGYVDVTLDETAPRFDP